MSHFRHFLQTILKWRIRGLHALMRPLAGVLVVLLGVFFVLLEILVFVVFLFGCYSLYEKLYAKAG